MHAHNSHNYRPSCSDFFKSSAAEESGTRRSRGSGRRDDSVHSATRGARLPNSSEVTPNARVRAPPKKEPAKLPPLRMDISVANSVASTPCHRRNRRDKSHDRESAV